MQTSWTGWIAFLVLAALVTVTSCQAYLNDPAAPDTAQPSGAAD